MSDDQQTGKVCEAQARLHAIEAADNVEWFPGGTTLHTDPDHVLCAAVEILEDVVVIGVTKEGGEVYIATSYGGGYGGGALSIARSNLLLDRAKAVLLGMVGN